MSQKLRMFNTAAFLFSLTVSCLIPGILVGIVAGLFSPALAQTGIQQSSRPAIDVDALIAKAASAKLHERIEWLRLLHYERRSFGRGFESQADNSGFFVSDQGKRDPFAELSATIRVGLKGDLLPSAVKAAPPMSVICQFPARWAWLSRELNIPQSQWPKSECSQFAEFKEKVKPTSVTFVFSAYYVNNPSSVFGHTLLRLNKQRAPTQNSKSTGSELLDYGVNYAANATTSNPVLYAVYGIGGYFPGTFAMLPFYYKVREYTDAESRDLWEYDLELKPDEIETLVAHLWELGSAEFDYFYLSENCAYFLLAALDVASARLNLVDRMPPYVMPIDAVKALVEEPGLVGQVRYRPSTQKLLETRYATLTRDEKKLFHKIRNTAKPADRIGELPPEAAARVLDTILDDIDHRFFKDLVFKADGEAAARKQNVLIARAKLPVGGHLDVPVTEFDRPDRSHGSSRWSLATGFSRTAPTTEASPTESRAIIDAELRFALHDISDPLDGFLPYSTVEFGRFRGRWHPLKNQADLRQFSLFTVSSLSPVTDLKNNIAWRVSIGAERVRDRRCDDCLSGQVVALGGLSFTPIKPLLVYSLFGPVFEASPEFGREKWLAEAAARAGLRLRASRSWLFAAEGEWRRVFDRETFDRREVRAKLRFDAEAILAVPFSLEAELTHDVASQEFLLRYLRYF